MSRFAEFGPRDPARTQLSASEMVRVREASAADLPRLAAIAAEREETEPGVWIEKLGRTVERAQLGEALVLVVDLGDGEVRGYGKADLFSPPADAPANSAPAGWYLTGLIVRPEDRRRGLGLLLTQSRLAWLSERCDRVYYFANEKNRATIELHATLGFVERSREFWFPGVRFEGGAGVLYEVDLRNRSGTDHEVVATAHQIASALAVPDTDQEGEATPDMDKVNLIEKLEMIREHWRPKVVGELNGQEVKLAKFQGTFVWHRHDQEDELFLGVSGRFRVEFRDHSVEIGPGEFIIVPRGVEHRTVAEAEASVLLFEPAKTRNTGNVEDSDLTAPQGVRI